MRPLRLLLIYLVFVFFGAALLSPCLFQFFQSVARHNPAFQSLARFPFHRFVNRSLLILSLLGLWPFLRSIGIRSWKDLGFAPLKFYWKKSALGFFIGFCSLAIVAVMSVCIGTRTIDHHHSGEALAANLLGATFAAIVVAILEETLFRGALFGTLQKTIPWPLALMLSSAIYALLHFFAKPDSPVSIHWYSGFVTLAEMFRGLVSFKMLLPGFLNLFIIGAILSFAFHQTGNLYFSIGLHAGWVFWLKSYGLLTTRVPQIDFQLWGSGKIIDGWLATGVLLFVFGILFYRHQNRKCAPDAA